MPRIEKTVILDTCAWIWISNQDRRITPLVQKSLSRFRWLLSSISLWEVVMLTRKKRLLFDQPARGWIQTNLKRNPSIDILSIDIEIALLSGELEGYPSADPADRMILASAIFSRSHLATGDPKLLSYCEEHEIPTIKI